MSNDRLKYLLEAYAADSCSPEELTELFGWIKKSNDDNLLKEKIKRLWESQDGDKELPNVNWSAIYSKIVGAPQLHKNRNWYRYVAAALLAGIVFAGSYFFIINNNNRDSGNKTGELALQKHDVKAPETNKATITLADGSVVFLDSSSSGEVAMQGDVKIVKLSSGEIGYQGAVDEPDADWMRFNTLNNPKGSKVMQMTLSDGSRVWLNSGSSITYPVRFSQDERKVTINGEAYFDVQHNEKKPFFVSKAGVDVRVLGTKFNVEAYDDEDNLKITLIVGSVKVTSGKMSEILKPGQQAQILPNANVVINQSVNLEAVTAWRSGRFIFDGVNIQYVMRQLSRWYNVEVKYNGDVTSEKFVGVFSRSKYQNISAILEMFEKTRLVGFSIDEGVVTVMPYKN